MKDARAFSKFRIWRSTDGRSVASLRTVLRVPFVDRLGGNPAVDGALTALWRQGVGAWSVHAAVGWDASFQEDLPADAPAVDFTMTLQVQRSF